jgi:addiction module HigA family antidote
MTKFEPNWVSPPGDTIVDLLEERGWSQAELARRSRFTRKHVNDLVSGRASITPDSAMRLESVLGATAEFWLNREAQYKEALERRSLLVQLERDSEWLSELPIADMKRFGWIKGHTSESLQVAECLQFFGVADVAAWRRVYEAPIAMFRASQSFGSHVGAVAAWIRRGELEAENVECAEYSSAHFRRLLRALRKLTVEPDPKVFVPFLIERCAESGVVVVFEKTPRGCPVSGATKWLSANRALIMLSLRYKSNDHLWFSFFHEAGHLLLHGKKALFLEGIGKSNPEQEHEANCFSANLLIPPGDLTRLKSLVDCHQVTKDSVRLFAKSIGIAAGVVVGRMQKESWLPWSHFNDLKVQYDWREGA